MAISHVFTNPVPDGTITSIVRPSGLTQGVARYTSNFAVPTSPFPTS